MDITSQNPTQTQKLATDLTAKFQLGDVICLYGDLGSGKTTFVQGLAKSLGIKKRVLSPTFVFIRVYKIKKRMFCHIDLYRLENDSDLETLGLSDYFNKNNIVVIEWAQKAKSILPKKRTDIFFEKKNQNERKISVKFRN
jgi:tRNA threonylcarbamoyladenosine biosynthesis protein TsaE